MNDTKPMDMAAHPLPMKRENTFALFQLQLTPVAMMKNKAMSRVNFGLKFIAGKKVIIRQKSLENVKKHYYEIP